MRELQVLWDILFYTIAPLPLNPTVKINSKNRKYLQFEILQDGSMADQDDTCDSDAWPRANNVEIALVHKTLF